MAGVGTKTSFIRPGIVGIVATVALLLNVAFVSQAMNRSVVVAVPDGDSVDLSDGRRVRLLGIDAPEHGRCMAGEAKETLRGLVFNKRVTLKDTLKDEYGRTLANVFVGDVLVNEQLTRLGLARLGGGRSPLQERLIAANSEAKRNELGIYSKECRQTDPISDCTIKGNTRSGVKSYYLPECQFYGQVNVDQSFGDRWFCSEQEAMSAGFTLAKSCQ